MAIIRNLYGQIKKQVINEVDFMDSETLTVTMDDMNFTKVNNISF